jgi:hypothetical protein
MIRNSPGSTIMCSIAISSSIEDCNTITRTKEESFHKAYGTVYSEGDSVSQEINQTMDLSLSLSDSKSISTSKNEGYSNALEHVYTIVNSNSKADSTSVEDTHTITHEESYSYTESEEHSHTRTEGGEVTDEINWSDTHEESKTEEYSRMEMSDFDAAKKKYPGRKAAPIDDKDTDINKLVEDYESKGKKKSVQKK